MKFARKTIGLGLLLVAMQLPAFCGEVAVLRNGFSIRFDRKVQSGETTRLYMSGGFIDIATTEIASFEPDDTPDVLAPSAVPQSPTAPNVSGQLAVTSLPGPVQVMPVAANSPATTSFDLDQLVRDASTRHRLDPDFVSHVIKAESNFENPPLSPNSPPRPLPPLPRTSAKLGVTNPFDPKGT